MYGQKRVVGEEKARGESKREEQAFSRVLTSNTVLVSRAVRLSLIGLATSCGVLGLKILKKENDMAIGSSMNFHSASLYLYTVLFSLYLELCFSGS